MSSWAGPANMMSNVLENLQQDPRVSQTMLGIGMAWDALRSVPVDLFANVPHFESEVEGSLDHANSGSPTG